MLVFGRSTPDLDRASSRWRTLVLLLLAGVLVGAWAGQEVGIRRTPQVVLAAGPLREVPACPATCLSVLVLNGGDRAVSVVPVAVGATTLDGGVPTVASPRAWTSARLSLPVACDRPRPTPATTVTLRVAESRTVTLALPQGADVPLTRYDRFCSTGPRSERSDLDGWERRYGRGPGL